MKTEELSGVLETFPTAQAGEVVECPRCHWSGVLAELRVIPPDFATLICPQCIEPVPDVPHCWFCGGHHGPQKKGGDMNER